jgi:alpha-L-arabinofuranosidase
MATQNYFVQWMYMHNRGDRVLPVTNNAPVREILPTGRVGVGTNKASAEFKDVRVVRSDGSGAALLESPMNASANGWTGGPAWRVAEGAYQQPDANATSTSLAGARDWSNYTVQLKFRKLAGDGSVNITVCDDGNGSWAQWILGGWGNQQHGILTHYAEQDQLLERVPGVLQPNTWHDVKVVVKGSKMECYLDNQLIQTAEILHHRVPAVFASATRDEKTREVIVKLVNPGDQTSPVNIQLHGAGTINPSGHQIVMSGDNAAENQIGRPVTVAPVGSTLNGLKPQFKYTLQPRSFTILRIGADSAAVRTAGAD